MAGKGTCGTASDWPPIKRGTTPLQSIEVTNLAQPLTNAAALVLTFAQASKTVLEKTKEDVAVTEDTILFRLTQEETLAFRAGVSVEIECAVRFQDNTSDRSEIVVTTVERILKDEVI